MRRPTAQRLRTSECQGFQEAWLHGGHVTHNCHVDEGLAKPRPPRHTDASPPLVSVVEASAAELCAISGLRQRGFDGAWYA